jgi:Ca2+-binding RTX toxin-like protein
LSLLALVGITAAVGVAGATGTPAPTCLGKSATITGSGSLSGTAGNDVIVGSESADAIDSKGGNDLICGLGGDDVLIGGLGTDQIDAGSGDDQLVGDVSAGGSQAPGSDPGVSGDAVGGGMTVCSVAMGATSSVETVSRPTTTPSAAETTRSLAATGSIRLPGTAIPKEELRPAAATTSSLAAREMTASWATLTHSSCSESCRALATTCS